MHNFPSYHPFVSAQARDEYLAHYDERARRWPVPSHTRTVATRWGDTFVRISGPASAPPLVLLPGMSSSSLMWETLIEPLAETFCTYAVDNVYDVGRSVWARPMRAASDFTSWLDEVFTALGLGHNVNLMGMSYGAWLTAQMAVHHPERLRKTVWIAPAGVIARLNWVWVVRALLAGLHPRLHRNFTYWMFADAVRTAAGRRIADELIADTAVMIRCYPRKPIAVPGRMTDETLRSIRVPSLVVVGENETVLSAKRGIQRVRSIAPHIRTELVPNAGHDLPLVQRDALIQCVLEFLNESTSNTPSL